MELSVEEPRSTNYPGRGRLKVLLLGQTAPLSPLLLGSTPAPIDLLVWVPRGCDTSLSERDGCPGSTVRSVDGHGPLELKSLVGLIHLSPSVAGMT